MEVGETRDISIVPEQAYGEYYEELVRVVPREAFPPNVTPAVGMGFELELPSGQTLPVRIIDIEGDEVTLDANHLLAGETLNFNIRLLSIDGSAQAKTRRNRYQTTCQEIRPHSTGDTVAPVE